MNSEGLDERRLTGITGIVTNDEGQERIIVLRGKTWFYDDEEVPPGTDGARECEGHWYPNGQGIAMPG